MIASVRGRGRTRTSASTHAFVRFLIDSPFSRQKIAPLSRSIRISAPCSRFTRNTKPSVVIFRRSTSRGVARQIDLLLVNLATIEAPLSRGAVVVFEDTRIRVRHLPIVDGEYAFSAQCRSDVDVDSLPARSSGRRTISRRSSEKGTRSSELLTVGRVDSTGQCNTIR